MKIEATKQESNNISTKELKEMSKKFIRLDLKADSTEKHSSHIGPFSITNETSKDNQRGKVIRGGTYTSSVSAGKHKSPLKSNKLNA